MAVRRPFWTWDIWNCIGFGPWLQTACIWNKQHAYEIRNWNIKANSSDALVTIPPTESRYRKIQYGHQAAISKVTLVKIKSLFFSLHTSDLPVKLSLDIQSQTKVRVRKTKNSIWLPGGRCESVITRTNNWEFAVTDYLSWESLYLTINTHTHTHTHIYIYVCGIILVCHLHKH